jgi:DNA-directed RNA polymerase subunit RPC12/RpoP
MPEESGPGKAGRDAPVKAQCDGCGKQFALPPEKVPDKPRSRFTCPSCGTKVLVDRSREEASAGDKQADAAQPEAKGEAYDIEPDLFPPGAEVAFVYVQDRSWAEKIEESLQLEGGYLLSRAENGAQALQKLRLNSYQMILLQDGPEAEDLLEEIGSWPGYVRREINCILIGDRAKSFDPGESFIRGVNSYLSIEDRQGIAELLEQAQQSFDQYLEPWRKAKQEILA